MNRLNANTIPDRLTALTRLLSDSRARWEARPFCIQPAPWEADWPRLAETLRALPITAIEHLEAGAPRSLLGLDPDLDRWCRDAAALSRVSALPTRPIALSSQSKRRIPRRKLLQIEAFLAAAVVALPPSITGLVDWCAGKGHLGRLAAHLTGLVPVFVEQRADLCRTASRLAGSDCQVIEADVTAQRDWRCLRPTAQYRPAALSLHACGHLTDHLLDAVAAAHTPAVASAMCCFHRLSNPDHYGPRSALGRASDLTLRTNPLRLATSQEQVARPRRRARRRRELAWRLGLDLLVREATGQDRYRPTGPVSAGAVDLGFEAFAHLVADRQALPLPARWDPAQAERAGQRRAQIARALGLVRTVFRRLLELWLVLDRAQALAEAGRPVRVGTFCPPALTPRNLLILSVTRESRAL